SSNLIATLLQTPGITPLNSAQTYGLLTPKGPPVSRTFSFRADGECGQSLSAVLQLQNGGTNYGNVSFGFMLGTNMDGKVICCNSADVVVAASAETNSVVVNHSLKYIVQVSNRGPKSATALRMTNVWTAPVTLLASTLSQGTCTNLGQSVVCDLGGL